MIDNMEWLLNNLENNIPFAFSRFNDGEMMAIDQVGCVVARGDQYVDQGLSLVLREALDHKQKNYYIGIPCSLCYPHYNKLATKIVGDYEHLTLAVIATNRNWKNFIDTFPKVMSGKRLIWIGGNDQNVEAIKNMDIDVAKTALVPRKNSWRHYGQLKKAMPQYFQDGDVVGISLGPTARVLARQWFEEFPNVTFIDMGSNLDPFTRNVWHNCHKGWEETGFNLAKPCKECN